MPVPPPPAAPVVYPFVSGWRHTLAAGRSCGIHAHAVLEIVFHRKGAGRTQVDGGRTLRFDEGDYILYPPHIPHDQVMDETGEDQCIHIAMPEGDPRMPRESRLVARPDIRLERDCDLLTAGGLAGDPLETRILDLRATALLLSLLRDDGIPGPTAHPAVTMAEDYMRKQYGQIRSLDDVARQTGLSTDRLRHVFKEQKGISLIQFLNRIRMDRACDLLEHSNLGIKEIAPLCGFRDVYYFSTVFRRICGCPPARYRREATP